MHPSPLPPTPAFLSGVSTPWHCRAWEQVLHTHPDREFADLIVGGIREGFQIGFDFSGFGSTVSFDGNMCSALEPSRFWPFISQARVVLKLLVPLM